MAKFCTYCGNPLEEGQTKCVNCGAPIKNGVTPVKESETNNSTNNNQFNNNNNSAPKSKVVAGLLGIFLGAFGVHNFYLGYTSKAVAQLLLTVLSCCTLSWISSLWGFLEGIFILSGSISTDSKGNPLVD